ncbi:hypothetical protein BGZ92_005161, partial [Podila epicladia]
HNIIDTHVPQSPMSFFNPSNNNTKRASPVYSDNTPRSSKESARPLLGHQPALTPDETRHFILKKAKSSGVTILSIR